VTTPSPPPPAAPPPQSPPDADVAQALQDPAALWEAVLRHAEEFVAVVDRRGIIRLCSRVDDGFRLDDVVGHSLARFTTPESSERLLRAVEEVFETGAEPTLETSVRSPEGTLTYFSLRLGAIVSGGVRRAVIVFAQGISPLKASEQALDRERGILRRLIEIQEQERQLVAYEIHDGLAQYIAGAIMHFEAHLHAHEGREPRELIEGIRLLRAAAEESRRLIGGLRPPALDELGIVEAIESLVADARLEIPEVSFTHALPAGRLPAPVETTIFRLVQESLTNARRHAEARSASVVLEHTPGGIHVRVSDDGRGFDPAKVSDDRFGLEGIRQRCRLGGVEPRIESAPGRGTTIDVVLPVAG
jgi:PAS domain S-box-containing protein